MSDSMTTFADLGLPPTMLQALETLGYETPSPIQAAAIPALLEGHDIIGQAQTGTGKTAAFALPLLARLEANRAGPQVLVLTPTRELAIQVAEAFQRYAHGIPGFHVVPIYGGQAMGQQLHQLRRGVHVVVGTPGRIMDHLSRESLSLANLSALVLDEADEMLRMGFIDDVEWILEHTPATRQTALFSATMPDAIRSVAQRHLKQPREIKIKAKTSTVEAVRQRYWPVGGLHKLDALTRILEVEEIDAAIIFVRTKTATVELADKLEARGYACSPLNGDMNQAQREKTVEQLKNEQLDIVIATDVAARGLDVPRISHVINYDIPHDIESYIHRIGRTGRAGRTGEAILFVAPREVRMLRAIERATRQPIEPMRAPSLNAIAGRRVVQFKQAVVENLGLEDLDYFETLVREIAEENDSNPERVAAALAWMVQRSRPLRFDAGGPPPRPAQEPAPAERGTRAPRQAPTWGAAQDERPTRPAERPNVAREEGGERPSLPREAAQEDRPTRRPPPFEPRQEGHYAQGREERADEGAPEPAPHRAPLPDIDVRATPLKDHPDVQMVRYRIDVGNSQGATPKHIVGAIANEAGIESRFIGRIDIYDDFSTVDLPSGMPKDLLQHMKKVRLGKFKFNMMQLGEEPAAEKSRDGARPPPRAKSRKPPRP